MTPPDPDTRLRAWADDHRVEGPDLETSFAVADALVARAARRRTVRRTAAGVAVAAVLLLGVLALPESPEAPVPPPAPIALAPATPDPVPPLVPEVLYQEGSAATRLTREIEVPAGDRLVLQLGPDVIGLGADSRLVVEEAREALTRLRLEQGGLAARVGAGGDEERFVVLAGEVTVESAEGRFGVFRDGDRILVRVREGRVRVRRGAEQWSVGAGRGLAVDPSGGVLEVLEEGEDTLAALLATAPREAVEEVFESPAPRPPTPLNKDPAPPPLPTVAEARARLLGGDQEGAVAALEARLEVHPTETDSWQLLATAHRRSGDRPAAAVAWEQVRRHGAGAIRAQAAYELAVLHQDTGEHGTAAELLAGLVDDPDLNRSLRPDAAVRLGRSQLALGQTEAARATLTGVVEDFPGTQPAATASGLLGGL